MMIFILIFLLTILILVGYVLFCLKKAHDAVWLEDEEDYFVLALGGIIGIVLALLCFFLI